MHQILKLYFELKILESSVYKTSLKILISRTFKAIRNRNERIFTYFLVYLRFYTSFQLQSNYAGLFDQYNLFDLRRLRRSGSLDRLNLKLFSLKEEFQ